MAATRLGLLALPTHDAAGGVVVAAGTATLELTTYAATVDASSNIIVLAGLAQLELTTYPASIGYADFALEIGGIAVPLIQVGGASTRHVSMGTSRRMYDGTYKRSPRITYEVSQFRTPPIARATAALIRAELNEAGPRAVTGFVFDGSAMVRNLRSTGDDVLADDVLQFEVWEREP